MQATTSMEDLIEHLYSVVERWLEVHRRIRRPVVMSIPLPRKCGKSSALKRLQQMLEFRCIENTLMIDRGKGSLGENAEYKRWARRYMKYSEFTVVDINHGFRGYSFARYNEDNRPEVVLIDDVNDMREISLSAKGSSIIIRLFTPTHADEIDPCVNLAELGNIDVACEPNMPYYIPTDVVV